jgi:hypothetical protein
LTKPTRKGTIKELIPNPNDLFSYSFFRTSWTKAVSSFYAASGREEPVYGRLEKADRKLQINPRLL